MPDMTADWRNWVKENLVRGVPEAELIQILTEHQFEPWIALQTVNEMKNQPASSAAVQEKLPVQGKPLGNVNGTPWSVIMTLEKPTVAVYANVLTTEECDQLVAMSLLKLQPSTTVDQKTGEALPHEHRTSSGTFFNLRENDLIQRIDERIATLMGQPVDHGEGLQILNYQIGGEYKPHFDYFPEEHAGSGVHIQKGGQRIATLILYLNDVEAGGETIFPELGLSVSPFKGGAVYFAYFHNRQVDPLTLHGGTPVIQGEKWIATKWVRESVYR